MQTTTIEIIPILIPKIEFSYSSSLDSLIISGDNLVGINAKLIRIAKYFGLEY